MLPRIANKKGVAIIVLAICVIREFVVASDSPSNILVEKAAARLIENAKVKSNGPTVLAADKTYECFKCSGDSGGCEDQELVSCTSSSSSSSLEGNENRCYIRFEKESIDVIGMGCINDFKSVEDINTLVKQKLLYICDHERCNGFENIPRSNECSMCNSGETESCATAPKLIPANIDCNVPPYTHCYQRVNNRTQGITDRGCLSSLEGDEFWNCLVGSDESSCKICTGDGCNNELIPKNRPKCHRCNSKLDANCAASPSSLSACPYYNTEETCVASYDHESDFTRRGCASDLGCDENSRTCQKCKGDGCNRIDLTKRFNGVYGAFQSLPLKCYQCEGANCTSDAVLGEAACENYAYQDCMTVFNDEGVVIERGCELNILEKQKSHCDRNPELCFNCKSNLCNDVTDAKTYRKCLYCDSSVNEDCLFAPENITSVRNCVEGCVAALYPRKSNPAVSDFVRSCFEDIEKEDRANCTIAKDCVRCDNGNNCNTDILPESRLSCLHCMGTDCDLPQSRVCSAYSKEDQCYMYFDNKTFSAVRLGCLSDISLEQVNGEIKQYFVCDGDNCNDFKNLPNERKCIVCNSANDVNCAVNPSNVTSSAICQNYPYTECTIYIDDDGHTVRGCLYDMEMQQFLKCKNGDPDASCTICTNSNCNGRDYPNGRQRCHRCNSIDDPTCVSKPANSQICPIYSKIDGCVTTFTKGVTQRGCVSDLPCDTSDRKHCRKCVDDNCNEINLSALDIGYPGKFQELPLSCHHCDECGASNLGDLRKCESNIYQTCTVAFGSNGAVIARGCSDDLDSICEGSGTTNCFDCKSNGCNDASKESDFIECVYCDATENDRCALAVSNVTRKRMCHQSCVTALYPRTNDSQPVYELIRTCLDDLEADERLKCKDSDNCAACSTADCNVQELGVRKSCYHCKGDNCTAPEMKTCRAVMTHDQCFIEFDESGKIAEMGCKSKYDSPDVKNLLYAKRLWLCDDDNCNVINNLPLAQKCAICNSRSDANCAVAPAELKDDTNCARLPYTQCYTRLIADGYTERGCVSNLESEEFYNCVYGVNATSCEICLGENCNKKVYPADRRTCFACSTNAISSCENAPSSSEVCLKPDEHCVTAMDSNGNTVRGCSSGLLCDQTDSANCRICDSNDCNRVNLKRQGDANPGLWQKLPLKCYTCENSLKTDCNNLNSIECQGNEYCLTVFAANGSVEARGCSASIENKFGSYCDDNSANCHNCNSNNCNTANKLSDYIDCVYCDSERNADCINSELINARRRCNGACMTALYPKPNRTDVFVLTRSCLDDKDEGDREGCKAGDELCLACNDREACNNKALPDDRWSCHVCTDEKCEDSKPQACKYYSKNERCFMLFGSDNSITRMGCISDLDEVFVNNNIDSIYLCNEGINCNSYENTPQAKQCIQCNSNDDPLCAFRPEGAGNVTTCSTLPNTQCFTRYGLDGSTTRGCVSSLSKPERLDCLSGGSQNCITCNNNACNSEIFPADRRRCHRCNSLEDPNCEHAPESETACPYYNKDDYCGTKVVYGATYRGCSTDFKCDVTNYQKCRMCKSGDNCNVVDLKSTDIGEPGKWQDLPLKCFSCEGESCSNGLGILRQCENNNLQNCGIVFDKAGNVVQRSCATQIYLNDTLAAHCDENSELCKFCKSNGCNNAAEPDVYVDCLFCDGTENAECVRNVSSVTVRRSCQSKCLTGLYPRTDETNPAYELMRSCLDDLEADGRAACENGENPLCKACKGEACNSIALPDATRLRCLTCENGECSKPISLECSAWRENDQCYALFDHESNKVALLGCASDFDNSQLLGNKRSLFLCSGDDCNDSFNFPNSTSCIACSSESCSNCVTDPKSSPVLAVCEDLPYTQCVVYVDQSGLTHRGCFSNVKDDVFEKCINGESGRCRICNGNNCNSEIFPAGRQSCHRCDSRINATCEDSPQEFAGLCPLYNENDYCVTKLEGLRTLRGCASDFTCDTSDKRACRTCDSDNCNTVNLMKTNIGVPGKWQDLPLSCYVCEGDDCISGTGSLQKCEGDNLQTCVTVFGNEGQSTAAVVKRGCSDQIEKTHGDYCEENSDKCIGCKSNGCNNAKSLDDYTDCYFCDSIDGKHCSAKFDTATRTRKCLGSCMVALYARSSSADPAYEMSRSCLDDMELDDQMKCKNGTMEYCSICDGARCNSMAVPAERLECLQCVGGDCEDIEPDECNAYRPNDQCYMLYDTENNIANAGCGSDIESDVIISLIKETRLRLCDGKNCNTPESVKINNCVVCDSSDDPRCATNPNLIESNRRCSRLPYPECGTRINEAGHTIRGCFSNFEPEVFYNCLTGNGTLCNTCSGDNCNGIDVFPTNRLRCHQCDSRVGANCESSPDSNHVCPIYDPADKCITNLYRGVTYRSCASSLKCYDESDKRNCRSCSTSGCNTADLVRVSPEGEPGKWQEVPLSCYHCDDEEDCAGGGRMRVCTDNIYQSCMTVFNVAGKVIENGCSDAVEKNNSDYCKSNPNMCFRCNSNGCNIASYLDNFVECLACDTDRDGNCVSDVKSITNTRMCFRRCMTALYPREDEANPTYHLARTCLNDLDYDEQQLCIDGKKDFCLACDSEKCNSVALPEKRLSCYTCEGENCQLPESKICPLYRQDDRCYVLYDETNSISAMGCGSFYSQADADVLLRQKRLYFCDGDNCNNVENLPASQRCTICNSRTDVSCATDPEALSMNVLCNVPPYTDCYSRVLSGGFTERGCLSSLNDDDFLGCIIGKNSSTCNVCRGEGCNRKIFPEGRAKCHICDSANDPKCEVKPESISICPKYDPDDTCVTSYRGGITERGCSSSVTCSDSSFKRCSRCSGDACNTINLARRQDDNYGKWQDLPLRCHVCLNDECGSSNGTRVETCQNENEQDCVVMFGSDGQVLARGCEYDIEKQYGLLCGENDSYCSNCKSNECNTAISMNDLNDCVYCDSSKDLSCLWQPESEKHTRRKCRGSCMTALYRAVSGDSPIYDLIRTCLDDKELDDRTKCSNGGDTECTACDGINCNVVDFPEDRNSCYQCVGEDECENPVAMKCPQYKKQDQCFIMFDSSNSVNTMGCGASFGNQDYETLVKTKRIYMCKDGENCNSLHEVNRSQKCAVCDSKNDTLCAVNARVVGTFLDCNMMPYTNCYSMLNSDGSTSRGCLSDLSADTFAKCLLGGDENCETCTEDGCNREIFPANRQQCHTCNSLDDPDCESFPTSMQPCPVVSDTESCKTALSQNETIRGCSSEVLCDANDSKTCRSCFGTSCNSIDLLNLIDDGYHGSWQDLPLKCHECQGEDCLASLGVVVECKTNIEQDCKIVFEEDGNVRRRGCSDDVDDYEDKYCRLNPELCYTCKSSECNVAWSRDEFIECVFCNSTENAACITDPESNELKRRLCIKDCMAAMRSDGEVIRSCLNDKEMFSQADCWLEGENGTECSGCSEGQCNNYVYPRDRRQCHVCDDSTCTQTKSQICLKYDKNDPCFAKYENGKVILMGCASSQKQSDLEDWKEQNKLYQCKDNNCNDFARLPKAVECITCDSRTTPECAQDPTKLNLFETCEGPADQCVVQINEAGHTLRGCASKLTQSEQSSCKNAGTCDICVGEKCNTKIFPDDRRQCHICSSLTDDGCVRAPNALQICPIYSKTDRCIAKFVDYSIQRDCESSLKCNGTSTDKCQLCDADGCNTFEFSSAIIISGSLLLTSMLAIIAMRGLLMAH